MANGLAASSPNAKNSRWSNLSVVPVAIKKTNQEKLRIQSERFFIPLQSHAYRRHIDQSKAAKINGRLLNLSCTHQDMICK